MKLECRHSLKIQLPSENVKANIGCKVRASPNGQHKWVFLIILWLCHPLHRRLYIPGVSLVRQTNLRSGLATPTGVRGTAKVSTSTCQGDPVLRRYNSYLMSSPSVFSLLPHWHTDYCILLIKVITQCMGLRSVRWSNIL